MNYKNGDYEASHTAPVWRDRADFIFAAFLGTKEGRNEWEQLWGQKVGDCRYILCCIPFFTYDLALGDEVETDSAHIFKRVIKASDEVTFRVWFGDQSAETRQHITSEIGKMGVLSEWSSENLLALSVSTQEHEMLRNYLYRGQYEKLPENRPLATQVIRNSRRRSLRVSDEISFILPPRPRISAI